MFNFGFTQFAAREGFEPPFNDSKSFVLPLDERAMTAWAMTAWAVKELNLSSATSLFLDVCFTGSREDHHP